MLEFLAGLAVGVVTSTVAVLVGWLVRTRLVVPRIEFSPEVEKFPIAVTPVNRSGYRYRIKFRNVGRRRVLALDVKADLRMSGISIMPGDTELLRVPLTLAHERTSVDVPVLEVRGRRGSTRMFSLHLNRLADRLAESSIFERLHGPAAERALVLEDFLALPEASLAITVSGYDEVSGSRKAFESPRYARAAIKEGRFVGMRVVPLRRLVEPSGETDLTRAEG